MGAERCAPAPFRWLVFTTVCHINVKHRDSSLALRMTREAGRRSSHADFILIAEGDTTAL